MDTLKYIAETILCSGLFIAFYKAIIAGKAGYGACRAYLVSAMILSAVIPAMDLPVYKPVQEDAARVDMTVDMAVLLQNSGPTTYPADDTQDGVTDLTAIAGTAFRWIYTAVAVLCAGFVFFNMLRISILRGKCKKTRYPAYTLAENDLIQTPFSFLRTIYMSPRYNTHDREMVIVHEASHIRHGHSYEKIAFSLMRSILWFNPFIWMAEKALSEVQEWEADNDVLRTGTDLTQYRTAIFRQLFGYNPDISCGLNHSFTKKRFIMMTKTSASRNSWLRPAAALPLLAAVFFAFGCGHRTQASILSSGTGLPGSATVSQTDTVKITMNVSYGSDGLCIIIDGKKCPLDEIRQVIDEKTAGVEYPVVAINVSGDLKMGDITDIKEILRAGKAVRLQYGTEDSDTEVNSVIPPSYSPESETIPITSFNRNNLHPVKIDKDGNILFESRKVSPDELGQIAEELIINQTARDEHGLPGCVFSLSADQGSPYRTFVDAQKVLSDAYTRARNRYAEKTFGKPFASLSTEEQNEVRNTLPIAISEAWPKDNRK